MATSLTARQLYDFGAFRLDCSARVLMRDGEVIPVPPKVVHTLVLLVENAGQPVDKETLMRAIWPDTFVEENNLTQNISALRKTLGNQCIETIPKRGYRFVGEVKLITAETGIASGRRRRPYRWAALVVVLLALAAGIYRWARTGPELRSLAVLPLQNLSGDPQQEYLADGITEVLIGELAKIRGLRIISRASVMRYKGARKPLGEIARELHVDGVVNGSVTRLDNRMRISVQVIDAARDRRLWAETFERDLADVPRWQGQVAAAIAHEVRVALTPAERARLEGRTVNRAAFDAYLRGRYFWNRRTAGQIERAIEQFRAAIDADPTYAQAYVGLADCYNQLGTVFIGSKPPTETRPLAIAHARKALEIEPELGEAHATLAYARLYDWDWNAAEQGFRRAIELNPSYASAHLWYSHFLSMQRRHKEALQEVKLARELDPLSPIIQTQVGWALQHDGRYEEAIQQFRKVLASDPNYLWALWRLGSACASAGRFEEGIQALEKAAAVSNRSSSILGTLAETYGLAGRRAEARKLLAEMTEISKRRYVPAIAFVHAYVGLGDTDRIFEWLEMAWRNREQGIAYLGVWEGHGPYRTDARFLNLVRRVGLEP